MVKSVNSNRRYRKKIVDYFCGSQCISRPMPHSSLIKRVTMSMYRYVILVTIFLVADSSRRTSQRSRYIHSTKTKQQKMHLRPLRKRCKLERHSIELTDTMTAQQLPTWGCSDQDQSHTESGI